MLDFVKTLPAWQYESDGVSPLRQCMRRVLRHARWILCTACAVVSTFRLFCASSTCANGQWPWGGSKLAKPKVSHKARQGPDKRL